MVQQQQCQGCVNEATTTHRNLKVCATCKDFLSRWVKYVEEQDASRLKYLNNLYI